MLRLFKSVSEDSLLEGCLKQSSKAQQAVYELYAPKMFAVCKRYIKENTQAEDILVVGFMKVFEKIGQFQKQGSLEGWIRKIMVNECLSYIRKNKNMYLEVELDKVDREPDYQMLQNILEEQDLLSMIDKLPTGYKTIFNLYAIEGFSHKEIAEMLQINENTSKSQLSRARAHLQKLLLESEPFFIQQRILNHES
ncbi:MAG: sigma-70 family RNA polymerase sigma factor [Bacteroidota bacterium]|jgi:RNA polymerase sigma-70 factor (ECF subfamily)|nr:sigma-70 family RNA polymerase sigma factor [Bacteroidota bacterium]